MCGTTEKKYRELFSEGEAGRRAASWCLEKYFPSQLNISTLGSVFLESLAVARWRCGMAGSWVGARPGWLARQGESLLVAAYGVVALVLLL